MEKLVSIEQIKPDINIDETIPFVLENDITIELKRCIPIHNVVTMVRDVINTLTDMDSMTYLDEMKSFIIRLNFLSYYTNIDIPEDVEEQYRFVISHAPMINQMIDSIDQNQWNDILSSIMAKEQVIKEKFIRNNDELNVLLVGLNNLMLGLNQLLDSNLDNFKNLDLQKLIQNISNKSLSESEVIDKILEHNKDVKPNRETRRKISKNKNKEKSGKVVDLFELKQDIPEEEE